MDLPACAQARLDLNTIEAMQYSPDRTRPAVAGSLGVCIHDARTYQVLCLLIGHKAATTHIAFSPGCQILASTSEDGTVLVWNPASAPLEPAEEELAGHGAHLTYAQARELRFQGPILARVQMHYGLWGEGLPVWLTW